MNNQITQHFNGREIRVITRQGEPWFVAYDVLRVLLIGNTTEALRHLGTDEVDFIQIEVNHLVGKRRTNVRIISESGLYRLIMRSDKPEARAFQDWVTRVVLPAIRKDGMYVAGEEKVVTGEMSLEEMTLKVMSALQDKVARLQQERDQLKPLADVGEKVVSHERTLNRIVRTFDGVPTGCALSISAV